MARSDAFWGIDIGQSALKALRCRPNDDPTRLTADAFDYIEYPKILSQPEANPIELVREALKTFLSRNSVRGDRVAISVSGQSGLARFIKLPPVETKKIPDIVKYEARQQIPFTLEDVVWDYQQMVGGSVEEGFALETEVGLFAMKRDQVYRALKPFNDAGIEVDIIQLTPLALYNFVAFDQMTDLPPAEQYDPDSPPESVVVISLGTDTTDLVVTNGFRVWQRSIPLGGSHFTKALTKELKLTFATAEHLKRNATQAEDPKALFQAMRSVFNDLLSEVQRSISYFTNLDRRAKIGRAVALGNAMKLTGLQRYLGQNLGIQLTSLESFRGLTGSAVVDAPAFKDNLLAFAVCYGLCVQGLRDARIETNLLPAEIVKDRMVRSKKPWAVGAAAAVLLGCLFNYFMSARALETVSLADGRFGGPMKQAEEVSTIKKTNEENFAKAVGDVSSSVNLGNVMVANMAGRKMWLDVLRAISLALPRDERPEPAPEIEKREELHVTSIECVRMEKLEEWYAGVKNDDWDPAQGLDAPVAAPGANAPAAASPVAANIAAPAAAAAKPAPTTPTGAAAGAKSATTTTATGAGAAKGPKGPGWVFQVTGYHYHNSKTGSAKFGLAYLRNTFITNLKQPELPIPLKERVQGGATMFPVGRLGIAYPIVIRPAPVVWDNLIDVPAEPEAEGAEGANGVVPIGPPGGPPGGAPGSGARGSGGPRGYNGGPGSGGRSAMPSGSRMPQGPVGQGNLLQGGANAGMEQKVQPRFDFVVQFVWQEKPPVAMVDATGKEATTGTTSPAATASGPTAPTTAAAPPAAIAPTATPPAATTPPATAAPPSAPSGAAATGPAASPAGAPPAAPSSGAAKPPAVPGGVINPPVAPRTGTSSPTTPPSAPPAATTPATSPPAAASGGVTVPPGIAPTPPGIAPAARSPTR